MSPTSRHTRTLRRVVVALLILGLVESFLIGEDIGSSAKVRWGVGIPLTLMFVTALIAYVLSRRRDDRQAQ